MYGGGDYMKYSPPNSYINILDYKSPKHLADYLKYLSANKSAYEAFFQWKPYWKPVINNEFLRRGFCRLCEIVNKGNVHRTYRNAHDWWVKGRCNQTIVKKAIKSAQFH